MPRLDVPPTKSSLRKIKSDLEFAHEGFDLLEQKREILVAEIMKNVSRIKEIEKRVTVSLEEFYAQYRRTAMEMGSDVVARKSLSEAEVYELTMIHSRFMGMAMPEVEVSGREVIHHSSLWGTTARYDSCRVQCRDAIVALAGYAAIMKTIFVLSRELKKVQRKVNALQKIFIPQNEEAKKYISDHLEEMEREEIFVKKLIRQGMA